jgi:L-2,4-diaminobutyrate decarboxylase
MAVYEMGIVANPMERLVNEILCERIGYDNNSSLGILTSGGTVGTLTALLSARANQTNVWSHGSEQKLGIIVSSQAHYAVDRAARIMGLGSEGIIKVDVNEKLQIKISDLEAAIERAKDNHIKIIALVASVCSTSSGSYDNIKQMHVLASKHNLWLHADGAHGGAVVFSKRYKHLVDGLELCDSVVIDWHKMLMIPALATSVVFKNGKHCHQTFQQQAEYLWSDAQSLDWYNSGKRTLECTKLMMSTKILAHIKMHGLASFETYVDHTYDLARAFYDKYSLHNEIEFLVRPESNIICFRKIEAKKSLEELNELNGKIRNKIIEDGRFYIVQTEVSGKVFLRISLMNPFTTMKELTELVEYVMQQ